MREVTAGPRGSDEGRPRVLLVDDEPLVLSSYGRTLRPVEAEIILAAGPEEGLEVLESRSIDVVIADYRMPTMNGDAFLELVRDRWPATVRLLNTAYADLQVVEEVVRRGGIFRFLTKPCDAEKLRGAVRDALAEHQRLAADQAHSKQLGLDLKSFREIFHSALDPMMVADLDGRIVEVNDAFVRGARSSSREAALRVRPTIMSQWVADLTWPEIQRRVRDQGHWSDEVHDLSEDRHALLTVSVVRDDAGKPYALAAIEKDMTARYRLEQQSRAAQYEVILALAKLAEYRDPETGAHLERFRRYSQALTLQLARHPRYASVIDGRYAEAIFASSPLHDIGKVGIPDAVLLKPGKLTAEEFKVMQLHSAIGAEVLSGAGRTLAEQGWLSMARTIAYQHHEKVDGTGYPQGLKGTGIDLAARIAALADAYDAITSKRVYKPAMSHEDARQRILEASGSHFDAEVVEAFVAAEDEFIRIKNYYSEGSQTGEFRTSETSMFRRIEQLIDTAPPRRPP
jgi:PAS domain S-box-containing protein